MGMAHEIKKLSPDIETQVGAIMLSEEGRIIASSFNGFLRGAMDESLPNTREGSPNKHDFIQHAERNMLYNCCYEGIRTKNTTIICTLSPCQDCLRACWQSGVKRIIFDQLYHRFTSTSYYLNLSDIHVNISNIGSYTVLDISSIKKDK